MSTTILEKFNAECTAYLHSKLQTQLLSTADPTAVCQYYFTEYQRCMDEQKTVVNYMEEQLASLEALKSCETTIDAFFERLKAVHQYERKQNEIFEQILHQLTKTVRNSSFLCLSPQRWFLFHSRIPPTKKNLFVFLNKSMN